MPDLLHLIGFALRTFGLNIEDLRDSLSRENVMTAPNALFKTQSLEKLTHASKRNVRVGIAAQDLVENLLYASHGLRRSGQE